MEVNKWLLQTRTSQKWPLAKENSIIIATKEISDYQTGVAKLKKINQRLNKNYNNSNSEPRYEVVEIKMKKREAYLKPTSKFDHFHIFYLLTEKQ